MGRAGSARKSTLGHMSKLMATAALASTVACSKCGGSSGGGGYGVVDPMPGPARCYGSSVTATARWVPKPGGGRWLEIDVTDAGGSIGGNVYSAPKIRGGAIVIEPEPFVVPAPILPSPLGGGAAGSFAVAAPDAAGDGGKSIDAGRATDAGSATTTSALGALVRTWRIDPDPGAAVHLVFDVSCPGASGVVTVTASFGHTRDGGEELITTVNET